MATFLTEAPFTQIIFLLPEVLVEAVVVDGVGDGVGETVGFAASGLFIETLSAGLE